MLRFENIQFHSEWEFSNEETQAGYKSGAIPGKLMYSKLIGNLKANDLPSIKNSLDKVYYNCNLSNKSIIKIADYSHIGEISIFTKRAYAQFINELNEKYNTSISITYIINANRIMRASLSLFSKFVSQKFVFTDTLEEAFSMLNLSEKSVHSNTKNQMEDSHNLIERIQFKPEWKYQNTNSDAIYNSGIIKNKILYSKLSGYISEKDIKEVVIILDDVFSHGEFPNNNYIRIADYTGINKISLSARKLYSKSWNPVK